jgi:hypothetical protein
VYVLNKEKGVHMYRLHVVLLSTLIMSGCAESTYKPMSGYTPEVPMEMARAKCKQNIRSENRDNAQAAQRNAVESAKANDRREVEMDCDTNLLGRTTCSGTSESASGGGGAAMAGAGLGALIGAAISGPGRMRDCMATYGFVEAE